MVACFVTWLVYLVVWTCSKHFEATCQTINARLPQFLAGPPAEQQVMRATPAFVRRFLRGRSASAVVKSHLAGLPQVFSRWLADPCVNNASRSWALSQRKSPFHRPPLFLLHSGRGIRPGCRSTLCSAMWAMRSLSVRTAEVIHLTFWTNAHLEPVTLGPRRPQAEMKSDLTCLGNMPTFQGP